MESGHDYSVAVSHSEPRILAAVSARLPVQRVPAVFASYLTRCMTRGNQVRYTSMDRTSSYIVMSRISRARLMLTSAWVPGRRSQRSEPCG